MAQDIIARLRSLNKMVAVLVGIVLLICAGFVLLDIILRQLASSFGGTDEISGYVMAFATAWGMSFTMLELGHVRIDILRSRVGQVGRTLFDLFSMLVLSGTITLLALKCWPVVEKSIANESRANTPLETPLALVQLPGFAGWMGFAVLPWLTFAAALALVLKGRFDAAESAIGAFVEEEVSL